MTAAAQPLRATPRSKALADAAHNVAWDCAVRGDRESFDALLAALRRMRAPKAAVTAARVAWARFS